METCPAVLAWISYSRERLSGGSDNERESNISFAAPAITQRGSGAAEQRGPDEHQSVCGFGGGGKSLRASNCAALRGPESTSRFRCLRQNHAASGRKAATRRRRSHLKPQEMNLKVAQFPITVVKRVVVH